MTKITRKKVLNYTYVVKAFDTHKASRKPVTAIAMCLVSHKGFQTTWNNISIITVMTVYQIAEFNVGTLNYFKCQKQKGVWGGNLRHAYLAFFFSAAFSAAAPAETEVRWRYEVATVSATVTSHVKHFPFCHGICVRPSGLIIIIIW